MVNDSVRTFKVFLGCICFFFLIETSAQNLSSIGKEKPLTISGGVSASHIFYKASGIESRRNPYSYFATGNLNFNLYDWSIPLTFNFSNRNVSFQQPFNQFSLHPTYKWATAHIGFTSISFSPYTLNGHLFKGIGIDLAPPGKFKVSALYGRFLKAVEFDSTRISALPSFQRVGYGFKAHYGDNKNFANLILFHATDELSSIRIVPDSLELFPQENLVLSIGGGITVLKNLLFQSEWATSAITRDTRSEITSHENIFAKAGLYRQTASSAYYNAVKNSLTYQFLNYAVGLAYERVDPQYRTLGSYFFNNDLENITINIAAASMEGKLNMSANVGKQKDNLDKSKISTMHRTVGSVNIAYSPNKNLNMSLSYSNFKTFTNVRSQFLNINQLTPFDNLDTLKFTQISQNASVNTIYSFGDNEKRRQSLNMNLMVQDAADRQGAISANAGVRFYNLNTVYSLNFLPKNTTLSASFNASITTGATNSKTIGPTFSLSKSFFQKKLKTTASLSANNAYNNSVLQGSIINARMSGGISIQKKHHLNIGLVIVSRSNKQEGGVNSFTEFTGTLGYSYSFAALLKRRFQPIKEF